MTALAWQQLLQGQHRVHGKSLFTVTELANIARHSRHALNVELSRLRERSVIERFAQGWYGLPGLVTPEVLVTALDSGAYITGAYALSRHNLITQMPVEITCFTNRRHNRSRVRQTSLGRFVFVCVSPPVYAPPSDLPAIASAEQSLCDYVLLNRRRGLDVESLVTLRNLDRLDEGILERTVDRYPQTVARALRRLVHRAH